jgi:hypothetical protein
MVIEPPLFTALADPLPPVEAVVPPPHAARVKAAIPIAAAAVRIRFGRAMEAPILWPQEAAYRTVIPWDGQHPP